MKLSIILKLRYPISIASFLLALCCPQTTPSADANGCCYYESTCEKNEVCYLNCDPGEGVKECEVRRVCEGAAMVFYDCAGSEMACTTPSQGDPTWVPCPNGFVYAGGVCTDVPNPEDEDCTETIRECTSIDCPANCEYGYQFCASGGPCGC